MADRPIRTHADIARLLREDTDPVVLREALDQLAEVRRNAEYVEMDLIDAARAAGLTWAEIGEQMDMTADGAARARARMGVGSGARALHMAAQRRRARPRHAAAALRAAWAKAGRTPERLLEAAEIDAYELLSEGRVLLYDGMAARHAAFAAGRALPDLTPVPLGTVEREETPSGRGVWTARTTTGEVAAARRHSREAAVVALMVAAGIGATTPEQEAADTPTTKDPQ